MPLQDPGMKMVNFGSQYGQGAALDPAKKHFTSWQEAQAELDRLRGTSPADTWMPETRRVGSDVQYLVGDRWAKQEAWDDPRFQEMIVNPWKQKEMARLAEEHGRSVADAQQRAEMAKYEYEDYLRRQDEIKSMMPSARSSSSTSPRSSNRMMGMGRGGY